MDWPKVQISDLGKIGSGTTPKRGTPGYYEGEIPWVKSGELNSDIITDTEEKITQLAMEKHSALKIIPRGSLLVAMYGATVGQVAFLDIEATSNQAVCHIVPNENIIHPRYLFHTLKSLKQHWLSRRVGGGQPNISMKIVKETEISLPPLDEQRRIAAILDKADEIEGATHRVQEMRSELITATFLDMFGDPIVNPNNFDKVKLESVTKFHKQGLYFNQGYSKSGNQLIRIADMRKDGSLNFGTMPFIEIDSKTQKQFSVEVGDFLFARSGSIGTCAIVREETNAVFGSFIIKFQFTENLLNDYFIHYYQLPQIEMMMRSMSHGTTNTNINAKNIKNLDVIVPPISLQEKFVQIVNSIKQMPDSTELSSTNLASITQEVIA